MQMLLECMSGIMVSLAFVCGVKLGKILPKVKVNLQVLLKLDQGMMKRRKKLMKYMKSYRKSTVEHTVLNNYVPGLT